MNGVWGCSGRSKKIHFYVNGETLCGRATIIDYQFPTWDESNSKTCETCKHVKELLSLGAVPAHIADITDNAVIANTA